jgi:hypothetical protein
MKTTVRTTLTAMAGIVILLGIILSCSKEEGNQAPEGKAPFKVYLTDNPDDYDSVNVDIQSVMIHNSTDTSATTGWFELTTNSGIYNLLDYTNGNDTLLTLDTLDLQLVSQIRLILGENNTVVEDGVSYDLETPSAQSSGLKLQIHTELEPGTTYYVFLDFDAEQSVIKTGNGKYKLKPVITATVLEEEE